MQNKLKQGEVNMSEISVFDLALVMSEISIDGREEAQKNIQNMFAENKNYKYDDKKTLKENIIDAFPQYNLKDYADYCLSSYRTFTNLGMDWNNKEDVKTYKSSCLAHLDMYKLPEKINPSDKDNPYQKKIEVTLPELLSVMTGKVVENVFYRGAHDKVIDMLYITDIKLKGQTLREKITELFPEFPLEKFAQEFERSIEAAKLMGLDERKGFTIDAVNVLAEGYNFPKTFVVTEKQSEQEKFEQQKKDSLERIKKNKQVHEETKASAQEGESTPKIATQKSLLDTTKRQSLKKLHSM